MRWQWPNGFSTVYLIICRHLILWWFFCIEVCWLDSYLIMLLWFFLIFIVEFLYLNIVAVNLLKVTTYSVENLCAINTPTGDSHSPLSSCLLNSPMLSLWVNEWIPICQPLPFLSVFLFLCAASASLNASWSPLPPKSRLFISVHSNTLYRFTVCRIRWVVWFRKLRRSTKELGDNVHTHAQHSVYTQKGHNTHIHTYRKH